MTQHRPGYPVDVVGSRILPAVEWLAQNNMTRFVSREATAPGDRVYLYLFETSTPLEPDSIKTFMFYEPKIAALFKLTWGGA